MEDPTKIDSSGSGRSSGNENRTEVKGNTTGNTHAGDFVAGTMLAGRYRVVGLVGKGGMGEVYKAEDLQLSQVVALKFLPHSVVGDEIMLARFRGEVRNARQVSHVNVCRVFDIGEIDGRHFLSMEFVDGDDLSELLTRVGRFTHERAVEISRQLCVGMEAIHKAGILHRDFKPANIIIDKKGVARITDFGIAGIESEIAKDGIRAGTPAYMAPEQITGKEVSTRSDIYALGLVIYEIFTGKQAFIADNVMEMIKMQQTAKPTNASEIVKGIDPLVESVIAQCLEKDPKNRPQSALHVAMALPGGNPMQMALDAGQTPSPEMVAAAPTVGALRPAVAFSLLAIVLFSLGLLTLTSKSYFLHRFVPLDKPPDVLRERARELMSKFGYQGADSYSGFDTPWIADRTYFEVLKESDHSPGVWDKLRTGQPALIQFWYRTSPRALERESPQWMAHEGSQNALPGNAIPGMARLRLDTKGRLLRFEGNPPRIDEPNTGGTKELDWADVFKEAGFDPAAFKPTEPQLAPPQAFDDRRVFSGVYPDAPDIPIRIEAAAYRGRLVNFEIIEPWTTFEPGYPAPLFLTLGTAIYFCVLILSVFLAVRHIRAGKSDLKGTVRVAVFVFIARMVMWLFSTHQVISFLPEVHAFWGEVGLIVSGLEDSLFWAATAASMYLAFEPYLRRSAPERVISWNRLLAGSWRDPLVGRDILIGLAAGGMIISIAYYVVGYLLIVLQGSAGPLKILGRDKEMIFGGISGFFARLAEGLTRNLIQVFLISLLIVFIGMLVRSKKLGVALICLIVVTLQISQSLARAQTPYELVSNVLTEVLFILVAARFGVLALIAMATFVEVFEKPVTTELGAWYAIEFVLYAAVLIALAIFGFYTSTAGQKLWQGKLLGDGD